VSMRTGPEGATVGHTVYMGGIRARWQRALIPALKIL